MTEADSRSSRSLSDEATPGVSGSHDGLTFVQYMMAGSIAGIVEHTAMFPVDTVKTRMQALATTTTTTTSSSSAAAAAASALRIHEYSTVSRALSSILAKEGPLGLYRGIGAMGLGAGPAHAVYFGVYEFAKDALGGNKKGHHPAAHAASGALATIAMDAIFTPMDVVKQRLQLRRSPYSGVWDCCQRMMKAEGLAGFYASYRTTVVMNVPFTAVHFATYEAAKQALGKEGEEGEEGMLVHVCAGGAAGALASAVTTPLDVVKTRLQCQGVCGVKRYKNGSVLGALQRIVREEGVATLWKGLRPRVLFHTPAAAICWATYEAAKAFLQRMGNSSSS